MGATWAAPVLLSSVAAPAYAASKCAHYSDNLNGIFSTNRIDWMFFGDPTDTTIPQADFSYTTNRDRLSSSTGVVDSERWPHFLRVQHPTGPRTGDWVKLGITFKGVVSNPTFTIVRIDQSPGNWADLVVVEPSEFSVSNRGANVVGDGTLAVPFRNQSTTTDRTSASEVTVTWQRTFTRGESVSVTYYAGDATNTTTTGQHIGVRSIGFDLCT